MSSKSGTIQSVDIDARIEQHKDSTTKNIKGTLARFKFPYSRNAKRILEQFMIDFVENELFEKPTNGRKEVAEDPRSKNSKKLRRILNSLKFCK